MSHETDPHAPRPPQPAAEPAPQYDPHASPLSAPAVAPSGAPSHLPPSTPPPPGASDVADRAAPAPTPPRSDAPTTAREGILRPIQESDYFSLDPAAQEHISAHIDEYFNQPLDIFPFWETEGKPDRFHVLFARQIEERFPADQDMRSRIHDYGRRVFAALCVHVSVKRMNQALALAAFSLLATLGPAWLAGLTGSAEIGAGLALGAMLLVVVIYWVLNAILFTQYRFRLENDSYELSREIVQRTRELQNLFTHSRAMADQAETHYQTDGRGWGARAMFLTRLTMWLGARTEYLEKYIQMELWRVRRERYWMRWFSRFMTPLVFIAWVWLWFAISPPVAGSAAGLGLVLVGLALLLGVAVSWLSYFRWQTPVSAIQDKLGIDGWVRYASLDVDNTVGDQVRRDKERLVEYRHLTRGR
ncbi:MAG: hypothetical protein ACK4E3_11965 [Brevundimonas sp.]|uniref:hypothetical protein n=1 Tax=Brevundimonas sp. TaxID=1871086 RepID=UPI00391BD593